MKKITVFAAIILCSNILLADYKVFLHSKFIMKKNHVVLADIVSFQGSAEITNSLRTVKIPDYMLKDGFVDKKELSRILSLNSNELFLVYGNAVRILPYTKEYQKNKDPYIRKGDTVNIIIKRKGISIEMIGQSCVNAYKGQKVSVKTSSKRKLKGILREGRIVEVVL